MTTANNYCGIDMVKIKNFISSDRNLNLVNIHEIDFHLNEQGELSGYDVRTTDLRSSVEETIKEVDLIENVVEQLIQGLSAGGENGNTTVHTG